MFSDPRLYLVLFFVVVTALLPDVLVKFFQRQLRPADWQIVQETFLRHKETDETEEGLLNSVRGNNYGAASTS